MMPGKVLLVANTDWYLYNFRLALAQFLRSQGFDVVMVAPAGKFAPEIEAKGFRFIDWQVGRKSMAPHREALAIRKLVQIYQAEKPVLVHHFTIKPVLYGSLAAKITKVPALVNSVTGEKDKLETVLPLIKQYGAAVIGLTIDDDGIPKTIEKRIEIAGKIIDRAARIGIPVEDIIIDTLAMSMGSDDQAGKMALDAVAAMVETYGVNVTMGCSNVSFGIPDRESLNGAFLAMAIRCGLTCPITNPLQEDVLKAILAADLSMGRDEYASRWITAYRKRMKKLKELSEK